MKILIILVKIILRSLGIAIPEAVNAETPIYIYTPCVTSKDSEPTLEAPEFEQKMKEAGYRQVEKDGKMEWDADYKVKRAMVYRYVGEFGEATCVVEITGHSKFPNTVPPRE